VLNSYLEIGVPFGQEVTQNGVTIRMNRVYYEGTLFVADVDVITPQKGATFQTDYSRKDWHTDLRCDLRYFFPDFSGMSGVIQKSEDDPNDSTISLLVYVKAPNYQRIGKSYENEHGRIIFHYLQYENADGEQFYDRRSEWSFDWPVVCKRGILKEFATPVPVDENLEVVGCRVSENTLALRARILSDKDDKTLALYAPTVEFRDGTKFEENYFSASYQNEAEIDGIYSYLTVTFPHPIDLNDITAICYRDTNLLTFA